MKILKYVEVGKVPVGRQAGTILFSLVGALIGNQLSSKFVFTSGAVTHFENGWSDFLLNLAAGIGITGFYAFLLHLIFLFVYDFWESKYRK